MIREVSAMELEQRNLSTNRDDVADQLFSRHRGLAILRLLHRSPEYRTNELLLIDWLTAVALACSHGDLRELASRLERQGLLRTENLNGLLIATLTEAGEDVALGRATCDDVLRPKPECPY